MALNQNTLHPALVQLGDILAREISGADNMLRMLRAEHQLLQHNDFSELAEMAAGKEREIASLNALAQSQGSLLRELGIQDNRDNTVRQLFAPPGMRELRLKWETLLDLLHSCQQQNQINGQALELARQHNGRALSLLFGGNDRDGTYSRDGARTPVSPSRYTALA